MRLRWQSNADRDGYTGAVGKGDGCCNGSCQPADEFVGVADEDVTDDCELVAADTCRGVVRSDRRQQSLRSLDEHLIAGAMTVKVVDRFETIEVEVDQVPAGGTVSLRVELGLETGPVQEPGQWVVGCLVAEHGALKADGGDVAKSDVELPVAAGAETGYSSFEPDLVTGFAAVENPELDGLSSIVVQGCGQRGVNK